MNDYRAYVEYDYNSIYHFGVLGMKWGVRRYQNYDGTYTQKGLEHYRKAEHKYDESKKKYEEYKQFGNKEDELREKENMQRHKKNMRTHYDLLKQDKLADEGAKLYREGKTITDGQTVQNALRISTILTSGVAAAMIADGRKIVSKITPFAFQQEKLYKYGTAIASGAAIVSALGYAGSYAVNHYNAKRLRAYYGHRAHPKTDD